MSTAPLVQVVSPWMRALLGLNDLQITQVNLGEVTTRQGWHGTAKVEVKAQSGVVPVDAVIPFFLDFRVNHPRRLVTANPDELHLLSQQLDRLGYRVLAMHITFEDGTQLEVIRET